jgi:LysR family nitrogen assimilation transcriptional regulator
MELRQLRYFLKVADLGSISKAAGQLSIAQSAVSHQVSALEHHVRARLFIRRPSGVELTEAGRLLYRHAQTIVRQMQSAEDDVAAASGAPTGSVSVGLPTAVLHTLGMPLLEAVLARHPGIVLHVVDGVSALLQEFTLNGRLDMAVLFLGESSKGLEVVPLLDEDLYYVAAASAPWMRGLGDEIPLEVAASHPLVVPGPGNGMRRVVEAAFAREGLRLAPIAELDSLRMQKACATRGIAGTFLPWAVVDEEAGRGELRVLRVPGAALSRPVSICTYDSRAMGLAAEAVHAILRDQAATLVRSGAWRGTTLRPTPI